MYSFIEEHFWFWFWCTRGTEDISCRVSPNGIASHTPLACTWSERCWKKWTGTPRKGGWAPICKSIALKWSHQEGKAITEGFSTWPLFPKFFSLPTSPALSPLHAPGPQPSNGWLGSSWALPFPSLLHSTVSVQPYQPMYIFSILLCFVLLFVLSFRWE